MNREGWLTELSAQLTLLFKGFRVGKFRVTCGWPCVGGVSPSRRRIGECHPVQSSTDGHSEIFISPLLAEPIEVGGTLCHEIAHVVAGHAAGHGKGFVRVCRHVGLTKGRPTSVGPGKALEEQIRRMVEKIGPYPHGAMVLAKKVARPSPVVGMRCPACSCKITISKRWLEGGPPTCSCGSLFVQKGEGR